MLIPPLQSPLRMMQAAPVVFAPVRVAVTGATPGVGHDEMRTSIRTLCLPTSRAVTIILRLAIRRTGNQYRRQSGR
jgi:hypothetical protein